jgi:DNA-binding transcriptional regulator GbsR (MarR family)
MYERADDPALIEVVSRDVRGKSTPEEQAFLRSADGVKLWRDALKAIRTDLETQAISRKADAEAFRTACMRKGPAGKQDWFEYKAGWDAWKTSAARFRRGVETNLAEAKRITRELEEEADQQRYRQLLVEALNFLNQEEAITYKYVPARDDLREKISTALYRNA